MTSSFDNNQIECTCKGQNPNCYKCGGWGYIDSVSANRTVDGPAGDAGKKVAKDKSERLPAKAKIADKSRPSRQRLNTKKMTSPSDGVIVCKCGSRVAISFYEEHLVRNCKANRKKVRKILKNKAHKMRGDLKVENPFHIRSMDTTKPYAHAYREKGRFGSHPSHDGFDDESTP